MKRVFVAALLATGLVGAMTLDARCGAASTFSMDFDGTLQAGGGAVHGTVTMDLLPPIFTPGSDASNAYLVNTASFSVTADSITSTGNPAFGSIVLEKGTDNTNFYGMPFDALSIQLFGSGGPQLNLLFFSPNTNPALPLLTLQTVPTTLTAWTAIYGPIVGASQIVNGTIKYFHVTGYTVTSAPAGPTVTPIPASLLLFTTASAVLAGMICFGAAGRRRPGAVRLVAAR